MRKRGAANDHRTVVGCILWVLAELQRLADAEGRLGWALHFVDSTVVRAHQHAAGAKGGDAASAAASRSPWCWSGASGTSSPHDPP